MNTQATLNSSWLNILADEFNKPYMQELESFLSQEENQGKVIYPPNGQIFSAFNHTPFEKVKVVIIGQDPYHGESQAHGLSFSVPKGIKTPPSLVNIYKELNTDIGKEIPNHGNLEHWADQGVLLLNSVLTVEEQQAASHQGKGWEKFTDQVIHRLNEQREQIVFLLWGAYAQKKGSFIDTHKHCVLKAPHPSPLAAHRGFFGCKHFSKTNEYLQKMGLTPIDW